MKKKETVSFTPRSKKFILAFSIQIFIAAAVCAQSSPGSPKPPVVPSSAPVVATAVAADAVQKRMEQARALAAAHQLTAAATELESIRASVKDDVVRNLSSLMLMGIYLEDGNYARAESLLEETFKGRSSKNEASVRTYFALAGQAVNGARAHVGRYRSFGINVSSPGLPAEAVNDLDRLRSLLERMSAQGKGTHQRERQGQRRFCFARRYLRNSRHAGARRRTTAPNGKQNSARLAPGSRLCRQKLPLLAAQSLANQSPGMRTRQTRLAIWLRLTNQQRRMERPIPLLLRSQTTRARPLSRRRLATDLRSSRLAR